MDLNAKGVLSFLPLEASRFQGRSAGSTADERSCSPVFSASSGSGGGHEIAKAFEPGGPLIRSSRADGYKALVRIDQVPSPQM